MRATGGTLLAATLSVTAVAALADEPTHPNAEQLEFFEKNVRPLLAENCWKCHGPQEQKGNLRLDSRASVLNGGDTGPAIVPGKPDESEMILAIRYDPAGYQMPPTGKLPQQAIDTLTEWVRMGAPWPADRPAAGTTAGGEFNMAERAQHWSFQPVRRPELPAVKNTAWPAAPIDAFILARLEEAGLSPAPPVDRRRWLRRVTFDLIGLPPTLEDAADFLAEDSPDAPHKAVDRLLASPHCGERWARHWLDLVRFAETAGHEFDYDIPYAWRYRDYIVRALNADLPYDQFILEHIAGDLLDEPRRHPTDRWNESILGTGFWWFSQGKHSPVDLRAEECDRFENQIDVLGKAFLGLTIACARCHDHKFDPISTADYYALAGYLQSTRRQIAFIDDEQLEATARRLEELKARHRGVVAEAASFGDQVVRVGATARGTSRPQEAGTRAVPWHARHAQEQATNVSHPLYAWAVLAKHTGPADFARARADLLDRLRRQSASALPDTSEMFDDFSGERYVRWFATGLAFGTGPTVAGDFVLGAASDDAIHEIVPAGQAHSGRLSPRFRGVLRSETFAITKPFIDYRLRRVGGRANPGSKHKDGQVHLIVDGFHFIQNPLYGGLSINTSNDGQFHWYRQDVSKLVGSRAYIEIEDEEPDGYIVVDRILFSEGPRPADPPSEQVMELLGDPAIDSMRGLSARYEALVAESVALWRDGKLASASHPGCRAALLTALLSPARATSGVATTANPPDRLRAFFTEYRSVVSQAGSSRRAIAAVDGTGENEHLLVRGNHKKPGPEVPRRFLEVFQRSDPQPSALIPRPSSPTSSGRLDLARRIADRDNPLTSRVLVNRLWQHHFGRGIVPTVDNFGVLGEVPSHPELLDWLATEFWSLKRLHRAMVLSSTYRMSSAAADPRAEAADPENRLWHRMPVRRLEAEIIRDAMLAVSGRLDRRMEGESVLPHLTSFMEGRGRPPEAGPLDGDGRRSLYISVRRNFLTPMFLAFDYPTPLSTMGRRSVSNVPAQALALMNNPFVIEQAERWARRTLADADEDASPEEIVERLYETAFTRPPSEVELAAALAFVEAPPGESPDRGERHRWADLCHVLLNVKEFVFVK